jgi:hypothetical protein
MYVCMYICMHQCMYVYRNVCITYVLCMYVLCMHIGTCVCMYVCMCVCTYVRRYVYVGSRALILKYFGKQAQTHVSQCSTFSDPRT